MVNPVTSSAVGSTCPPASSNPGCRTSVVVLTPGLTINKSADNVNVALGTVVKWTITVTNSGQTPYAAASFTDPLADVVDDATYRNDVAATAGTASFTVEAVARRTVAATLDGQGQGAVGDELQREGHVLGRARLHDVRRHQVDAAVVDLQRCREARVARHQGGAAQPGLQLAARAHEVAPAEVRKLRLGTKKYSPPSIVTHSVNW